MHACMLHGDRHVPIEHTTPKPPCHTHRLLQTLLRGADLGKGHVGGCLEELVPHPGLFWPGNRHGQAAAVHACQ